MPSELYGTPNPLTPTVGPEEMFGSGIGGFNDTSCFERQSHLNSNFRLASLNAGLSTTSYQQPPP